jgi:hypothetical protein
MAVKDSVKEAAANTVSVPVSGEALCAMPCRALLVVNMQRRLAMTAPRGMACVMYRNRFCMLNSMVYCYGAPFQSHISV